MEILNSKLFKRPLLFRFYKRTIIQQQKNTEQKGQIVTINFEITKQQTNKKSIFTCEIISLNKIL